MNISFAEKKAEAVARMKMLRLPPDVIREFESNRSIMCFDGSLGIAMKLGKEEMQRVRKLEEDKDILVYAILYGKYNIGNMAACLYVSDYQHEWERDRQNIEFSTSEGMMAYVYNRTDPELSEFGYIGVDHTMFGELKRIW